MKAPRLYLAGPEVFRSDAVAEGARLKALAQAAGAEGIYPLDGDPLHDAAAIKRRCREMIDAADAVVANITPFRGHHMDPGTAWEIGYAEARGKPVHLWSDDPRAMVDRVPAKLGIEGGGFGYRDADGHLVENFGLVENLMISSGAGPVWSTPQVAIVTAATEHCDATLRAAVIRRGRWRLALIGLALAGATLVAIVGRGG